MDVDGDLSEATGVVGVLTMPILQLLSIQHMSDLGGVQKAESVLVSSKSTSGILPCGKPLEENMHCGSQLAL